MRVAILGGSIVGSVTALLFARSGWDVTVIDAEFEGFVGPDPVVRVRPGAPHAVQAHGFMSRTWFELTTRLPDIKDALLAAGVPALTFAEMCPPPLLDGGRPGDGDFTSLRARRVTLDNVVGQATAREPGITRVAAKAGGLVLDEGPVPTVRGVGLAGGSPVLADLVVDAGGRRSPVSGWLAGAGVRQPERVDRGEVSYYTRHFRFDPAKAPPPNQGFADIHEFPTFQQFLFLGDNATGMLALSTHGADPLLRRLRHEEAFTAVIRANEDFAAWFDVLEPTSQVFCLGALDNRMRGLVDDGRPVVRGLQQVGDALAMTNPTRGRGISMGLASAGRLHDLAQDADSDTLALAYDAWQHESLAVYYRETNASDVEVIQRLRAELFGSSGGQPRNAPSVELPQDHPVTSDEVEQAAGTDPDLFRLVFRATMLLDDERRIAAPEVAVRVRRILDERGPSPADVVPRAPEPQRSTALRDRDQLEVLLAAYA